MPSSDPITIPKVLKLVTTLKPYSILDIGCGNGRYGMLFREVFDLNYGRMDKDRWQITIDAVEVEETYITPVHKYVYDHVIIGDWLNTNVGSYDIVFMGDVLEHFTNWKHALSKAKQSGDVVIVVAPNWQGSINQGAWFGNEYEAHQVELTPSMVGGKCVYANSKCFITVFGEGLINHRDILL